MSDQHQYEKRGVSATKDEVHQAIQHLDKGLYPNAFCKILPDMAALDPKYCNIMHADTAGTKTSLAYLYWKETGDYSVWEGIAQDAIVMNLDDMGCVGCVDNILLSSTIGRNKNLIDGKVLATLIDATRNFCEQLANFGIRIHLAGGETADVGDIVRTIDVGYTAFARLPRNQLIVNDIRAGDAIVGLASYGQSAYENTYNAGMGSNGLTSARHDLLHRSYAHQYPDSYDPNTPEDVIYLGGKRLKDTLTVDGHSYPLGKLMLSPTRTYLPFIKALLDEQRQHVHGMIHCTGGGQTKVKKFIDGKRIVKDNLLPVPPLFQLIQQESAASWKEMYQVFNMGHRLEVYLPEDQAEKVVQLARSFRIEAQIIGHVEEAAANSVRIEGPYGTFDYQ